MFNNTRTSYVDEYEKKLIGLLYGNVLDVGCGETARSTKLINTNEQVLFVKGFDPLIRHTTKKNGVITCKGKAQTWKNYDGYDFIVSFYNSIDYLSTDERKEFLDRILATQSNIILACHKRFVLPTSLNRLWWDIQALFKKTTNFHGGTYCREIRDKRLLEYVRTSNMVYYIRVS